MAILNNPPTTNIDFDLQNLNLSIQQQPLNAQYVSYFSPDSFLFESSRNIDYSNIHFGDNTQKQEGTQNAVVSENYSENNTENRPTALDSNTYQHTTTSMYTNFHDIDLDTDPNLEFSHTVITSDTTQVDLPNSVNPITNQQIFFSADNNSELIYTFDANDLPSATSQHTYDPGTTTINNESNNDLIDHVNEGKTSNANQNNANETPNQSPTDLELSNATIAEDSEDGAVVGTVSTTDPDLGDSFNYALIDNANGLFDIDSQTGEITVSNSNLLDFETNNSHNVTVEVTDTGGNKYTEVFDIVVEDINEAPTDLQLSNDTIDENSQDGTTVGTVTASDPDGGEVFGFSLLDDAGGRFTIDSNTGELTVADGSLLNYEANVDHNIIVKVTDSAGNAYNETFNITINDVNEAPTDLNLSNNVINENSSNGSVVGTISSVDPDQNETFTYNLLDSAGGRFSLDPNTGQVTVANGNLLNYETNTDHNIAVEVTDSAGNTYNETFNIIVNDVSESPNDLVLSNNTIDENSSNGSIVGSITSIDPDNSDTFTYSLLNNAGGRFTIDANTGQITVADGSLLDYETNANHNITVEVIDSDGNTYNEAFNILVNDINENPTDLTLSNNTINENSSNGSIVGSVSTVDPDAGETFTYALLDNAGGRFAVDTNTGQVTVANGGLLDYETNTNHNITVEVTDSGGNTYNEMFNISVNDINENPTDLSLSNNTIDENSSNGSVVGSVSTTDPDAGETFTYALLDNASGRFAVDTNTGQITVANGGLLDYETNTNHNVTVEVTDSSGNTYSEIFNINVNDINENPTDLSLSNNTIDENSSNGSVVGSVSTTDPDAGETFTYALLDNASGRFAIDANTGQVTVANGSLLDYETNTNHNVTVEVTDSAGNTYNEAFNINVNDVSESPEDLVLSNNMVDENSNNGTAIGTVTSSDPDGGETFTYALTDNAGGRFAIDTLTGEVTVADGSLLDFESDTTHDITVEVTDSDENQYSEVFTISVKDINENPTDLSLSNNTIDENSSNGSVVGSVSTTDPDAGETFTYALLDNAGGRFAVDTNTGQVTVANGGLLDYETNTNHNITVEVTDSGW